MVDVVRVCEHVLLLHSMYSVIKRESKKACKDENSLFICFYQCYSRHPLKGAVYNAHVPVSQHIL